MADKWPTWSTQSGKGQDDVSLRVPGSRRASRHVQGRPGLDLWGTIQSGPLLEQTGLGRLLFVGGAGPPTSLMAQRLFPGTDLRLFSTKLPLGSTSSVQNVQTLSVHMQVSICVSFFLSILCIF